MIVNQKHAELDITTAEAAVATKHHSIARVILENYFRKLPQKDSFFVRGKLCLALVMDHEASTANGDEAIRLRRLAVKEVMVALTTSTDPTNSNRYKFLVFNASVALWHITHQYIRPTRARFFAEELKTMSSALENIDDMDTAWRIMYLSATAFALEDADNRKGGSEVLDKAIDHAEKVVAAFVESEKQMEKRMTDAKTQSDALMFAQRTQEARQELLNKPRRIDPDSEDGFVAEDPESNLQELTGLAALPAEDLKERLDEAQAILVKEKENWKLETEKLHAQTTLLNQLYLQRVNIMPSDTKRVTGAVPVMNSFRAKILVQLQLIRSGAIQEKDWVSSFQQMIQLIDAAANPFPSQANAATIKKGAPATSPVIEQAKLQLPASVSNAICETLLDMSRCAWALRLRDFAIQLSDRADQDSSLSPVIRVKSDLCKAIRMVADISLDKPNEETEMRLTELQMDGLANNKRIEALKLLERVIGVCASRLDDSPLLQEISIVIWNTAIPLLQPHLRQNVYRAFQLAAECLEEISSPLVKLRAQLHFELAKCEEQNDFVVKAKTQTLKALHADYGDLYDTGAAAAVDKKGVVADIVSIDTNKLEGEQLDRRRSMDTFIKPLDNILSLRSSVYDAPEDIESQIQLMMQQMSESKSRSFQTDCLFRCLSALLCAIEKPDDIAAANAIMGNGAIPPAISKLKAELAYPELEALNATLDRFGMTASPTTPVAPPSTAKGKAPAEPIVPPIAFSAFTELTQCRLNLMHTMATTASRLGEDADVVVEKAAVYILNYNWNPDDAFMRRLILQQIDVANLLTEALVIRIANEELSEEQDEKYMLALEGFSSEGKEDKDGHSNKSSTVAAISSGNEDTNDRRPIIEPRCLGVISPFASEAMQRIKALVIKSTTEALKIALRIKDDYSIQNGIVFFWNHHLHVFRRDLVNAAMPEMLDFLKLAHTTLLTASGGLRVPHKSYYVPPPPEIDYRLSVAICEAYSVLTASLSHDISLAIDIAHKGCSKEQGGPSAYTRRRLCEHACRLAIPSTAAQDIGGKAAPKATGLTEPLKFDDPFLNVFGALVFAEAPAVSKEVVTGLAAKIRTLIDGDIADYIRKIDIPNLSKEQYDQLMELQACALTRLTRLYVSLGDIYGAYAAAEQCTKLIEGSLTSDPDAVGSGREVIVPRVWRWMSLCERYFGAAVSLLIQPDGQEVALQNELRLAALRHYTLSTQFGRNAREDALVVDAAIDAWNTAMPLIDVRSPETLRPTLQSLLYMMLDALAGCTEEKYPQGTPAAKIGRAADDLKQRFYISIVEGLIDDCNWDGAMKAVLKAFDNVPQAYHRAIWKLRVVVMSKRGKSALDGIQKLKEGDVSLQARVYAVLARSASIPAQQLEAYSKAVEVLGADVNKVEYILEMAQYLSSGGIPKSDIYDLLLSSLDALSMYLSDPNMPIDDEDDAHDDDETMSKMSGSVRSKGSKAKSAKSRGGTSVVSKAKSVTSRAASKRGSGSVASRARTTAGSIVSVDPTLNVDIDPYRSNLKHLDYALRALAMMAVLESQSSLRLKKCLEAIYFIDRSIALWNDAMALTYRRIQFRAIPPTERKDKDFFTYECAMPKWLAVPTCSVDLLFWSPSELFENIAIAGLAHVETALDIPSTIPFVSLPLTIHYLTTLSEYMQTAGFLSSSLLCLAWARIVLIMQTNKYSKITASSIEMEKSFDAMHVCLYYKTIVILKLAGLESCASALPKALGRTDRTVTSFLHTFSEEAGSYVAGGNILSLTSSITNKELPKSETLDLYGFNSYTPVLPGTGFDKKTCALDICQSLYDLSSYGTCRSLLNAVLPHCQRGQEHRNVLIGTHLLAKLEVLAGRYSNVVALLEQCGEAMEMVGDPSLLAKQAVLLIRAYSSLEMLPEAIQTANSALESIDSALVIQLPDVRPDTSKSKLLGSAMSVGGGPTTNETATMISGTSGSVLNGIQPGALELSYEGLESYLDVCLEVIRVLCVEAFRVIDMQCQYPINQLSAIDDISEQCILRISSVEGQTSNSLLYGKLLEAKAWAIYSITMHAHPISSFRLESNSYQQRIIGAVQGCVERQYEACEVYRSLLSYVPSEHEVYFLSSDKLIPPARAKEYEVQETLKAATLTTSTKDAKKDAKGKEAPVAADEKKGDAPNKLSEMPSGVLHRTYGNALLTHAGMLASLAQLKGHNAAKRIKRAGTSGAVGSSNYEPTVIDKYLEESAPVSECHKNDFVSPELVVGALSAADAVEALKGSQLEVRANVVSVTNMLNQFISDEPLFDGAWTVVSESPLTNAAEGQGIEDISAVTSVISIVRIVAEEAQPLVTLLKEHLYGSLANGYYNEVMDACSTLIECYGRREANKTALYIMLAQSVKARQHLMSIWRDTVPDNSEVSCALRRLNDEGLTSYKAPTMAHTQKAKLTDTAFLANSTVAYKRLGLTQPIGSILSNLSGCHVICIHYSATDGVLTVTGGSIANQPPVPDASGMEHYLAALPGEWMVEKMVLTIAEQRSLQTLNRSHTSFREDTVKFVASYGDQMSNDTDVEEVIDSSSIEMIAGQSSSCRKMSSHTESSSFMKAEHAIAERFRAIIGDIERLLDPVLGTSSRIMQFLKATVHKPTPSISSVQSTANKGKGKEVDKIEKSEMSAEQPLEMPPLYLLVDPLLQNLPVEAMRSIQGLYNGQVVRDYSVHMIGHRKQAMLQSPSVKASGVRAIVDTYAEDKKSSEATQGKAQSMSEIFTTLNTNSSMAAGGDKWKPVSVSGGTGISLRQWLVMASEGENLTCYVHIPGKIASILPPTDLALMDLRNVSVAIVLEGGNNDESYRRQNVVDNKKSPRELVNDDTLRMAALLSLCGVNSIVTTQWGSSFSSQALFAKTFWHSVSIDKMSLHQGYVMAASFAPSESSNKLVTGSPGKKSKDSASIHHMKEFTVKKWLRFSKSFIGVASTKYDPSA